MSRDEEREVVYVEREAGSLKPILFGALLGSGGGAAVRAAERRRDSPGSCGGGCARYGRWRRRRSGSCPSGSVENGSQAGAGREDRRDDVRSDLERRLAEARARRRAPTPADEDDDEEPVA